MGILAFDHVQVAIPSGGEPAARKFYAGTLGFEEVPKPAELAARGGAWFRVGAAQLHLGVEPEFRAARKAHTAFLVSGLADLVHRCEEGGYRITRDAPLPGIDRVHVEDPFGNRLELMERRSSLQF